ncbi:MAG: phage ORF5 protein [Candidatus Kapaibacterium sp.]
MTIYQVISVRDSAANAFNTPAYVPTLQYGIRSFADAVNNQQQGNALAAHPQDYTLWHLGSYDDSNGHHQQHDPVQIARGQDVKELQK